MNSISFSLQNACLNLAQGAPLKPTPAEPGVDPDPTDSLDVCVTWSGCLVSQEGLVYAVEFSHRSGRDLLNVAKKRTNIIPIIEDARHPHKYRMLVGKSSAKHARMHARPGLSFYRCYFLYLYIM